MERKIELVHSAGDAIELSESRGKGLNALSMDQAEGVTIVSDVAAAQASSQAGDGRVISALSAEAGPSEFDG